MNDLIKLLGRIPCNSDCEDNFGGCQYRKYGYCTMIEKIDMCALNHMADHLIANGVTVQRWIPVSERLPEDDHDVMIVASGNPVKNVRLENSLEIASFSKDDGWILECWPDWETAIVTHWMPLPEPPKEDVK